MKPTLLVFTSTFPRWPNDTDPPFVYELAKRFTHDFQVHVLTPHYPGAKTKEIMDGLTVYRYRYFLAPLEKLAGSTGILPTLKTQKGYYFLVPFFIFFGFLALLKLIHRLKPDVVHAHWLIPQGFLTAISAKILTCPFIVTVHGGDFFALNNRFFRWMKAYTIKCARKVTIVSTAMLSQVQTTFPSAGNLVVVPMGVDSQLFHNGRRKILQNSSLLSPVRILFVGRLTEKKGVKYLIEAISLLKDKGFECKVSIVGGGELRKDLQALTEKLGNENFIEFLGAKSHNELAEIYASHDIFVGPSIRTAGGDTEGLGLTFVEAGMSGCVLIGTDVGGIGDVIHDGKTGFLIPEKNSKAIAETIAHVLHNRESVEAITQQCRKECMEKFDLDMISRKYSKFLLEIVE